MDSIATFLRSIIGWGDADQPAQIAPQQEQPWQPEIPAFRRTFESRVTMTEIVVPSHCDSRGYCLGGTVLSWIDIAAGIAAKKHGVYPAVTRSVDAVHFISPITLQNIVILQASVNRAWKTSMEVGVRVIIEDVLTAKRQYCCHAYLTFVALPQPPLLNLTPQLRTARPALFSGSQNGTNPADQTSEDTSFANSPAARRFSFSLPKSNSNSRQGGSQRSVQLPAIDPVTAVDIERFNMAQRRREQRLQQSKVDLDEEISMLSDIRDQMRNWTISLDQELPRTDYGLPSVTMKSTFAESVQLVLPQHANSLSITFGGQVMKWMEGVAAVSASRFAHVPIVTASIDSLQFHRKTMIGDCLTMRSIVTRVFQSSMEVYVFVDSENLVTGKQTFTNEAFFSMVAMQPSLSLQRVQSPLPSLQAENDLENALSLAGEQRRIRRLEQRDEVVGRENHNAKHLASHS